MTTCPYDLRLFLKEREFDSCKLLAEAADRFRNAHSFTKNRATGQSDKGKKCKGNANEDSSIVCHKCGESGHIKPNCPANPRNFKQFSESYKKIQFVNASEKLNRPFVDTNGRIFNKKMAIEFDSACSTVVVNEKIVPKGYKWGHPRIVYDYLGLPSSFPSLRCFIDCKFYKGWVDAISAPLKFANVLLGRVPGVKIPETIVNTTPLDEPLEQTLDKQFDKICDPKITMSVETRSSRNKQTKPLSCPDVIENVSKEDFMIAQSSCSTLGKVRSDFESENRF